MAVNYVKFRRGSIGDFLNLAKKDTDTLYFITTASGDVELYLGDALISGSAKDDVGATKLSELSDIDFAGLADGDLLVYDAANSKWVVKSADEIAPKANVIVINGDGTDHVAQITNYAQTNEITPVDGDIAVVKDVIFGDKVQHTAYVFDGSNWAAMDGNYSAENVYFKEDLLTTTAIGNVSLSGGQATIEVKGKNIVDLFNTLYVKEDKTGLKKSSPGAKLSSTSTTYYEIGKTGSKDITVSMNGDGEYKYGYTTANLSEGESATAIINDGSTGVVVNSTTPYELTFNGSAVSPKATNGATFTLSPAIQTERKEMKMTGKVNYQAGGIPVSNLKKAYPAQRIGASSASTSEATAFRWYIPFYQGFTYDNNAIADHANITAAQLTGGLHAPTAGTSTSTKIVDSVAYDKTKLITATAGNSWRQYYIAYPKSYGYVMSGAKDGNGIDCTVLQAGDVTITYGSGDNATDVVYAVYYINNAAAYDTKTISWTM
jgi:hypothetical protein